MARIVDPVPFEQVPIVNSDGTLTEFGRLWLTKWRNALLRYDLPVFANNAAAKAGGLKPGELYRTGGDPDLVAVVHK